MSSRRGRSGGQTAVAAVAVHEQTAVAAVAVHEQTADAAVAQLPALRNEAGAKRQEV